MIHITDKHTMYGLLHRRVLGNTLRSWTCVADYLSSGFRGYVGLRTRLIGGPCVYWLTRKTVRDLVARWVARNGVPGSAIAVQQMAPHCAGTLQGELSHDYINGYMLHASTERVPMRDAREWRDFKGAHVLMLLRRYLWPSSFDDVMALLDEYPDAVVEFSAFSCEVGWAQGRNHVIWEVREY